MADFGLNERLIDLNVWKEIHMPAVRSIGMHSHLKSVISGENKHTFIREIQEAFQKAYVEDLKS